MRLSWIFARNVERLACYTKKGVTPVYSVAIAAVDEFNEGRMKMDKRTAVTILEGLAGRGDRNLTIAEREQLQDIAKLIRAVKPSKGAKIIDSAFEAGGK